MRRFIGKAITIISFSLIGGCAPDARNEGSKVTNTVEFPRPKVVKEEGFNIARGATRIQDMKVIFDPVTKGMKLKGKIEYIPMKGESLRVIDLDLSGVEDGNGFIPLTKDAQVRFKNDEKVAAKATCLGENGSCEDSFVDIYIYIDGVVYHHQIESHQDLQGSITKGDEQKSNQGSGKKDDEAKKKKAPESLKSEDKQDKKQGSAKQKDEQNKKDGSANQEDELQQTPDIATEEDDSESEGDSDDVGDVGQYVGSIKEDIETLLQIKPEEVKKEEPSKEDVTKEEPKGDDPKKEDPKKEEPKNDGLKKNEIPTKEEPKKDDPKKEQPKNGDPNKVTPKKEEPKKEDPKKEQPKNGDSNKVTPKKEEPKKEEPQKEKPKDGDSNKVTPTKDESKKEEPKKEEPKKETLNMNISQAIGPVNAGRLENAVDFYKYEKKNDPTGFHIIRPERKTHFGTNELLYIIAQIGQVTKENLPGQIVSIGDLSYERGGRLGKHKSHQNGLDSDVSYYFNKKSLQGRLTSAVDGNRPHPNWMYEEQWKLFKYIVKTQYVDRIFIHKVLKKALCNLAIQKGELEKGKNEGLAYDTLRRLNPDEEFHDNHFHLRVKCSKAQKRCRQMAEPKPGSGCF